MNATKHRCCAMEVIVLTTESIDDLKLLEAAWFETFNPKTQTETTLVDELVANDWLRARSSKKLAEVDSEIFAAEPKPLDGTERHHMTLINQIPALPDCCREIR